MDCQVKRNYNISMLLDKIFTPISLIVLNLLIIISAEFAGGGLFFFQTGFIHILAIFFIILFVFRIFYHHYTFDPIFEKFVHFTLAAALVFAVSHAFEFVSMMFFYYYSDATFANVVNFYLIGIILITIGAELFIKVAIRRSAYIITLLSAATVAFLALIALFLYNSSLISLESGKIAPIIYTFLIAIVGVIGFYVISYMKKIAPVSRPFVNYVLWSVSLLIISTLPYIFYYFIEEELRIEAHQIIYLSHFFFFASLSLLFLSFSKLSWKGIYQEVRNIKESSSK
ncbi:hypothetical protein HY249_00875 [Candidatus Azambacteria bacterium]|nr:hypothetical protein [Candidatus Azambacteria bacterium]